MSQKVKTSSILWAADSNQGMVRPTNEDYFLARPDLGLWLVCDGLGGHSLGDQASRICARTIAKQVAKGMDLKEAVLSAHQSVWDWGKDQTNPKIRPGSTVAALLIRKRKWHIAWVGDSRIWLYDEHGLEQLTEDHTVSRQLVDWGLITSEEAKKHPYRNKLTSAIGTQKDLAIIGFKTGRWQNQQLFLLATDGLAFWDEPQKLSMFLGNAKSPSQAVWWLKKASLKERGEDNVTIAIVGAPNFRAKKKFIKNVPLLFAWHKAPQAVKWGSE